MKISRVAIIAALALVAGLPGYPAASAGVQVENRADRKENNNLDRAPDAGSDSRTLDGKGANAGAGGKPEEAEAGNGQEADLVELQVRMAVAAERQVGLAERQLWISMVGTFLLLLTIRYTMSATKAATASAAFFVRTERGYLLVDTVNRQASRQGDVYLVDLMLRNVGRTILQLKSVGWAFGGAETPVPALASEDLFIGARHLPGGASMPINIRAPLSTTQAGYVFLTVRYIDGLSDVEHAIVVTVQIAPGSFAYRFTRYEELPA